MNAGTDIQVAAAGEGAAGRLRYIDALRAIAALMVVWLHVTESFAAAGGPALGGRALAEAAWTLDLGRIGVVVFFLISGFVIPPSLDTSRPAPFAGFAVKRLLRIYPAYWVSIPLSAFAAWWLWGRPFGATELLVNATLLQDLLGEAQKPDIPRTEQILQQYRPHRTMAAAHLWASLAPPADDAG